VQERAFPRAGFARQRHPFADRDIEIDPAQHGNRLGHRAVGLGQVADAQHDCDAICLAGRN
jgi:hypothetical protein